LLNPHASAVFVPATLAAKAIEEAIENEIPLLVSVAEGMPVHDCLRVPTLPSTCFWQLVSNSREIHQMLRTQTKSRLIGPNSPGIIVPKCKCRVGLMPIKYLSLKRGYILQ
jgi:succinyl-CoA synthetase alpha subunit